MGIRVVKVAVEKRIVVINRSPRFNVTVKPNRIIVRPIQSPKIIVSRRVVPRIIKVGFPGRKGDTGDKGDTGLAGPPIEQFDTLGVTPTSTAVVDSVLLTDVRAIRWIVTLWDLTADKYEQYGIDAVQLASDIEFHETGNLGDLLTHFTDVVINGVDIELQITNLISNDLKISVLRIPTLIM